MDTGQKTESLAQLIGDIEKGTVVLPEFQRDFVWEIAKTFDLFDSFVRDIFVGALIYGVPSFEITVRELDMRPRAGKGSRQKLRFTSYSKRDIDVAVKTRGFRLLLDGQQRATSLYRALKGIDEIFFVAKRDHELGPTVRKASPSKRSLEDVLFEIRGEVLPEHVNVRISDVFGVLVGEFSREREQKDLFMSSCSFPAITEEHALDSYEFEVYLSILKNLVSLFRQEKLISYYLLDTDENKFALFFERSNSKGIQLSFIDILAAKLYAGFNLREHFEQFNQDNPNLELNREIVVRSISYIVSRGRETGRAYILSRLTSKHFHEYWTVVTDLYKAAYGYMLDNRLIVHPSWIPYENVLIPFIIFLFSVPKMDSSQITREQAKLLKLWFWLTILSRRYSSAAQTYVLEDALALEKLGKGDSGQIISVIRKMKPLIQSQADLYSVCRKYDALYKGVLNFVGFDSDGLENWENGDAVSWQGAVEDHHIFPTDYLRKGYLDKKQGSDDLEVLADCVLNRTLIPKFTNLKISNKKPSEYLCQLKKSNPSLQRSLEKHLIPERLMDGTYDGIYNVFLEDRAKLVLQAIKARVYDRVAALHADPPTTRV